MHNKIKRKNYFQNKKEEAFHGEKFFSINDKVKILPSSPKFPIMFGVIKQMVHGNFGDGRIFAEVETNDGMKFKTPLGRLRKI